MKQKLFRKLGLMLYCVPLFASAQTLTQSTFAENLYKEGKRLFDQKAYTAVEQPLKDYLQQTTATPENKTFRMEAAYMLACAEYELQNQHRIEILQNYLLQYPETPHEERIKALIASAYFFEEEYEDALKGFNEIGLEQLSSSEREDMMYRMAISYLQTEKLQDAAIWLETLRTTTPRYEADCTYYLSYIRYTQNRYDESLKGFLSLQDSKKYKTLVPYYIAEIYLQQQQFDKAEIVAQNYLSHFGKQTHHAQMHRILGTIDYHRHNYTKAITAFKEYIKATQEATPRRDALYMLGLSCYHCGIYSEVANYLGEVTKGNDALAQNAYLHNGLAYLKLADKIKARMAFEQAAASDADRKVKEQAAYNYALCIHETAYSAFGQSVNVFEKFLNEFPQSQYIDKVSSYLVDVYMNTRSYEAALQSIERITQPTPSILEAKQKILFQLGTQDFANAQFAKAIQYFSQSITLGNYNRQTKADALYWRGEAHYRLNQLNEATRDLHSYQQQTTDRSTQMYALSNYNIGYILFHEKKFSQAREYFLSFLKNEKEVDANLRADAYNRIGDCYLNSRQFNEAQAYYTKAEEQNTTNGDYAYYQLALVAGLQKDYNGKVKLLNKLTEKYPQSPYAINAIYEKGRSQVQGGENNEAIHTFSELLKKYPESPLARKAATEIGMLYYQNEEYDRAISAYKQVVTNYPGSEEARLAMRDLKSIYVDANRVEEYVALTAQMPGAIKLEGTEQDSLTYIAAEKVYMKGEKENAQKSFVRYLQSYPEGTFSLNAHYYLANLAKENGDEEAVMTHTTHLLAYPDTPYSEEALLMHSEILYKRKEYAEAIKDYKQLQAKASTTERRSLGTLGILRSAAMLNDCPEIIIAATTLLNDAKLSPELKNEALYYRGKAYLIEKADEKAINDLKQLAKDTRTIYGAEAKYLIAQHYYNNKDYVTAENEAIEFIEQSTPHAYWLARTFVLLSDVYIATDKKLDARQYLLSLQQNYQANDDIANMIEERLKKLED